MTPDTLNVDSNGNISIGGVAVAELAEQFGTPLYVLDYTTLTRQISRYRDLLTELQPAGMVCYAGKSFLSLAMAQVLEEAGVGLDVVSGGELHTALKAGFTPSRIVFHGNLKTAKELSLAVTSKVGYVVVDSLDELMQLGQIAIEHKTVQNILLRLTPGIEAHTHEFIQTGQFDTKFGFGIGDGLADAAVETALSTPGISLKGFHAHIGSQILEEAPFLANADILLEYARKWHASHQWWPEVLDLGGGFGVRYQSADNPPDLVRIVQGIRQRLTTHTPSGMPVPRLFLEPGRSIVAEAGITVYTVGAVKTVVGGKKYVAVDGGMGDNIRPALYQAQYQAMVDSKVKGTAKEVVTLAGRYCETGDLIVRDAKLPSLQVGDRVIVLGTGAYNYAMASNYNRVPRPAVVAVANGQARLWVRGETWDDLVQYDEPFSGFPQ